MLILAERLLNAAGFRHDQVEDSWATPAHPRPVVTVECDEDGSCIIDALLAVHATLESCGFTYNNFAIRDGYLSQGQRALWGKWAGAIRGFAGESIV